MPPPQYTNARAKKIAQFKSIKRAPIVNNSCSCALSFIIAPNLTETFRIYKTQDPELLHLYLDLLHVLNTFNAKTTKKNPADYQDLHHRQLALHHIQDLLRQDQDLQD